MGIYDDDGVPEGTYNYSHNMGGPAGTRSS